MGDHATLILEWLKTWDDKPYPPVGYEAWLEARIETLEKRTTIEHEWLERAWPSIAATMNGVVVAALAGKEWSARQTRPRDPQTE